MNEIKIKRNGKDDLVFTGEELVTVDDREWMGVAPNWWELKLYRSAVGKYILASTFHLNYPRRSRMYGAVVFSSKNDVAEYLRECNSPNMIVDALMRRASLHERRAEERSTAMHMPFVEALLEAGAGAAS
ncbi:hypothetical protein Dde_2843 [Oleidesulfovibrio alaskensis G20]|jgi:hypothetical protein|uniref:Uncharacterized protein n=1 Tax=Oleidesulfovibrio alaskensis (strain ATCC BAA-1058 / DSM 17464 / G20) TaxID=207559 RepID=Q30XF8_OLEA2|nr:hypothetical protein [Oleidesulfovibrio alaskensis]ABB39638.1 hypothetical protein Dde_2843 [Oleidesulfovibrio alaskensis G20]MBG0773989.1 hypothetical protein [Oleidesulfovibrio alaskensis]MBL3582295.1 hypothetical protein [Oleidesulfovibrio alaskensis]